MRRIVFVISLVFASTAAAQDREKIVGAIEAVGARYEVSAAIQSGTPVVAVWATRSPNRVLARFAPGDVRIWADTADRLIGARVDVRAGETVKYHSPFLGTPGQSDALMQMMREAKATSSDFWFFTNDRGAINTVAMILNGVRAREFVALMRRAADAATTMSKQ